MANYLERIWPDFKELARSKRKENKKFFTRLLGQASKTFERAISFDA